MATSKSYEGTTYSVPATGETNWGGSTGVDGFLIALADNVIQHTGGTFTLSADLDFGGTAHVKAIFKTRSSNPAASGILRLANDEGVAWRNAANDGNLTLKVNASDLLEFDGSVIQVSPASTTDNAIARYDGTTGKLQNSAVTVADSGASLVFTAGAGGTSSIFKGENDGSLVLAGGNANNVGGNIILRAGSHADGPDFLIRASTTTIIHWDDSAGVLSAGKSGTGSVKVTAGSLEIEQPSTGDVILQFDLGSGTQRYTMGIDDSDSDAFVIAASASLGSSNALKISTAGAATFSSSVTATSHIGPLSLGTNNSAPGVGIANTAGTDNVQFYTGSTLRGSINASGLWSIGTSSGSQTHLINGQLSIVPAANQVGLTITAADSDETLVKFKSSTTTGVVRLTIAENSDATKNFNLASNFSTDVLAFNRLTGGSGRTLGSVDMDGDWIFGAVSTNVHRFNCATQTSVGAAGGADALPATPTGYIEFNINGTSQVIPYYAKS